MAHVYTVQLHRAFGNEAQGAVCVELLDVKLLDAPFAASPTAKVVLGITPTGVARELTNVVYVPAVVVDSLCPVVLLLVAGVDELFRPVESSEVEAASLLWRVVLAWVLVVFLNFEK